jgi:hypothetical protein
MLLGSLKINVHIVKLLSKVKYNRRRSNIFIIKYD